jgi:hypothetical protein
MTIGDIIGRILYWALGMFTALAIFAWTLERALTRILV